MADRFEADLEELVQRMASDLARDITALILRRLGITGEQSAVVSARRRGRPPAAVAARRPGRIGKSSNGIQKRRRVRATSDERAANVDRVARVINDADGLSAGEIERAAGLARPVVASALKTLKEQGLVFMGGTRRYARYATTQAAADRASAAARTSG